MIKLKNQTAISAIGMLGVAVTVVCLLIKTLHNSGMSLQARTDTAVMIGLIVGFSLINSAALLQLRNKVDSLGRRR